MMRSTLRGSANDPTGLKERGYLLVWFSIIVIVLFAIAGMSYDFGQRYYEDTKAQRAADAAALAGVVYRDGTNSVVSNTNAKNAALRVALRNGYSPADVDVDLSPAIPVNELKVTIHAKALNYFANAVGVGSQDFWRSSQAAYDVTTPLGSPTNVLGYEALNTGENSWVPASGYPAPPPTASSMWLNIDAPRTPAHSGDQFDGSDCTPRSGLIPADNCYDNSNTATDTNQSYVGGTDEDGQFYTIHKPTGSGSLNVQIFDPTFAHTGSDCLGSSNPGSRGGANSGIFDNAYTNPAGALAYSMWVWNQPFLWAKVWNFDTNLSMLSPAQWSDYYARFVANSAGTVTTGHASNQMIPNKLCTGDTWNGACTIGCGSGAGGYGGASPTKAPSGLPGVSTPESFATPKIRPADNLPTTGPGSTDGPAVVTTFTLYKPGTTRAGHSLADQVPGCPPEQFGTYGQDLVSDFRIPNVGDYLQDGGPASPQHYFRNTFRKWVTLCAGGTLPTGKGDYLLRVQTDVLPHANPDWDPSLWYDSPTNQVVPAGQGSNKYSLRAGVCSGTCTSAPSTPADNLALQVYANGHITVAANVASGSTFFLTKAVPAAKNRTLTLTFFDPGDLTTCGANWPYWVDDPESCQYAPSSADGFLTIGHTPSGIPGGAFEKLANCAGTYPSGSGGTPTEASDCVFKVGTSTNGRLLNVTIPLPPVGGLISGCDPAAGNISCWVQAQFTFPTSGFSGWLRPTDHTTWTASINGSPVRLVG